VEYGIDGLGQLRTARLIDTKWANTNDNREFMGAFIFAIFIPLVFPNHLFHDFYWIYVIPVRRLIHLLTLKGPKNGPSLSRPRTLKDVEN
jgi:hypothetical protein